MLRGRGRGGGGGGVGVGRESKWMVPLTVGEDVVQALSPERQRPIYN